MSARSTTLVLCLPLLACSAVVRELSISCEDDGDCRALNQAEGLEESCVTYQCRSDHKGCEKQPRDKDRDGVPDALFCRGAGFGEELDCDDADDARSPTLKERCDDIDNDCDSTIDEGALGPDELALESVSLPSLSSLSLAERVDGRLLVATTRAEKSLRHSALYSWPGASSVTLQDPAQRNCDGALRTCSLDPLAIAASPSLLLALGVEFVGPSLGRVRFALRKDWSVNWDDPPIWDAIAGAASTSNLREGVDVGPACGAAPGAHLPRLALGARADGSAEGLAVWRQGELPGPLVGIGLRIDADAQRVEGLGGACSTPMQGGTGQDAASVQVWPGTPPSYWLAFDSARGVELLRVSQLMREPGAFAAAEGVSIDEANARNVASALTQGRKAAQLGLAWRVQSEAGSRVRFARLNLLGDDARPGAQPEPFEVRGNADVREGPFLAYLPQGVVQSADPEGSAGWLVLWVEGAPGAQKLMAVRVAADASAPAEQPFALYEAPSIQHAFAYAASDTRAGYGFVTGSGVRQLNIGSLVCRGQP